VAISGSDEKDAWLGRHRAPLVGFVLPLANGDFQAAEDVVQETMLRGWQHSAELKQETAGPWLRTVARNIAISSYHRRRRARPREVPLEENAVPDADDGVDQMPDAWLIGTALNSLDPAHRAVITELFYHRRTVAEVAETLGIPEGTVRSRCFYGLRTLTATSWGTSIQLQLRGVPQNVECRLVVRSQTGGTEVSGAWDAWQEGPLSVPASVSWLPPDIASLQVTTPADTLLTISVSHQTGDTSQ
jgi:RNA polymerase sigma-70 factor, ECF subfamily